MGSGRTQQYKLQLFPLTASLPAHIINDVSKSQLIWAAYNPADKKFSWKFPDERTFLASRMMLVDDRLTHLQNLPPGADAVWYKAKAKAVEQRLNPPGRMQVISSLVELVAYER